jgi:CMP/dCMP kinase
MADVLAPQSIVFNGDLGSGKTTVSVEMARRLGLRRVSVGDLYRQMAAQRGMTALQLNLHAALDDEVDGYVDRLQSEIARSGEQLVVDSRLAWFYFTRALKVHLIVDAAVAARRVLARPSSDVEAYSSVAEAEQRLRERSESERERFLRRYGVDKSRLRNYDLVCDTTRATPDELVDHVVAAFQGELAPEIMRKDPPLLLVDPARIHPTTPIGDVPPDGDHTEVGMGATSAGGDVETEPLALGYVDGRFFVIDGHHRLSAALRHGRRLVPARLVAEGDEAATGGVSARQSFESAGGKVGVWTVSDCD